MNPLIAIDHWLFEKINREWTSPFFDLFFPAITDLHRQPLAIAVIASVLAFWLFKRRIQALQWTMALAFAIALSDSLAYRVVKALVQRNRPATAGLEVILRTHPHSEFSFPSNHAANIFAAATVLCAAFPSAYAPLFFIAAALVAYSRVYVGVHFPADVAAGAILGVLIGFSVVFIGRKRDWLTGPNSRSNRNQK